jgi:hypothetical protein
MRKPGEIPEFARFIATCCEFQGRVVTLPLRAGKSRDPEKVAAPRGNAKEDLGL